MDPGRSGSIVFCGLQHFPRKGPTSPAEINYSFILSVDSLPYQSFVYLVKVSAGTVPSLRGAALDNPRETSRSKGHFAMSWDQIEGQWKQRRGKAMHHWGKMMNDELAAIAGKYEELVGNLQEKYGIAKEEARAQVNEFKKAVEQLKTSNNKLIEAQKALSKKLKAERIRGKSKAAARTKRRVKQHG